jgi:hypothetical protein
LSLVGSLQKERRHPREIFREFQTRHGRLPQSVGVWIGPEGDFTLGRIAGDSKFRRTQLPFRAGPAGFARRDGGDLLPFDFELRIATLDKFLARTTNGAFAIRRLRGGLTPAQAARLRAEAERRIGRIYHLGFKFDSSREFCSKFVYGVYRDALALEVGRLETFEELLAQNPGGPVVFWRLWFFGFIPWRRRTVTPTSQLRSPLLQTVLASQN